jgi:hypothetical protein
VSPTRSFPASSRRKRPCIVHADPRYSSYRLLLDDPVRMEAHAAFRNRVFVEPRRLDYYLNTLGGAGFQIESVYERNIRARVEEW